MKKTIVLEDYNCPSRAVFVHSQKPPQSTLDYSPCIRLETMPPYPEITSEAYKACLYGDTRTGKAWYELELKSSMTLYEFMDMFSFEERQYLRESIKWDDSLNDAWEMIHLRSEVNLKSSYAMLIMSVIDEYRTPV